MLLMRSSSPKPGWLTKMMTLSLLVGALALGGCDDGGPAEPEDTTSDTTTPQGTPSIDIFSSDPSATTGFAPLEVDLDVLFETGDPVADVEVVIDWGDGTVDTERTRTTLTPNATEDELLTPEQRTVTGTHIYEDPGDFEVTVTVTDTSNTTSTVQDTRALTITVEELPDLIASSVGTSARDVEIDELFDFDFSVINNGTDVERGFFVRLYLVSSPQMTPDDFADTSSWVELALHPTPNTGLARGASIEETLQVQVCDPRAGAAVCEMVRQKIGDGTWYPAVWVDPPNDVRPELNLTESNEVNNFRVSPAGINVRAAADLPDLRPRNINANPRTTDVLSEVSVSFEIANIGEQDAPSTRYSIFLSEGDRTLDPTDLPLSEGEVAPVATGGAQGVANLSFPLDVPITLPGEFWVLVRADIENDVDEITETNNINFGANPITVTGAQQADVDVAPINLVVGPAQTYVGGQYTIAFDVTNLGEDDPGTFRCTAYRSTDDQFDPDTDTLLVQASGDSLPGMDTEEFSYALVVSALTPPGTYYVFVSCDPNNVINELDETNNIAGPSAPILVNAQPAIDYTVQGLTGADGAIMESEILALTFDVCNQGVDAAGPIQVRAYLSADGDVTTADTLLATAVTTTPALETGQCETVTLMPKVDCLPFIDTYTVGVIVDPGAVFIEDDETNNLVTGTVDGLTVTGGMGSLCACVEDPSEGGGNNTQANAATITLAGGEPRTATLDPLALCDATDFYTFDVMRGDTVDLTVSYDASITRLGLRFFDPTDMTSPVEVLDSTSTGTLTLSEEVLGTAATETVYVEVFPLSGGARNYYSLDVTVTAAPVEPELFVQEIFLVGGSFPSILSPVEWDVTVFNDGLTDASSVAVTTWLSTNTTLDASDLEVGTQIIPTVGTIDSETVSFSYTFPMGTPSAVYYVIARVDPMDTIVEVDETNNTLASSSFTIDADCFADAFEGPTGNDNFSNAYPVNPTEGTFSRYDDLSVCNNGRTDYYLVCAPSGPTMNHIGALQPSATFQSAIEVKLFNLDQVQIGNTALSNTAGVLSVPVPVPTCTTDADCHGAETCNTAAGYCEDVAGNHCVYAQVALRATSSVISRPYSLVVDSIPPTQTGEPTNDVRTTASEFSPLVQSLAAGSGHATSAVDIDWFYLDLKAGTEFSIAFEGVDQNLRLLVYTPTTNFIDLWKPETITLTTDTRVEFRVTKVANTIDRPGNYQIRLDGLEGLDLLVRNVTQDVTEVNAGGSVFVTWQLANERLDDVAQPVTYRYLLSDDAVADAGDLELDRYTVGGPAALDVVDLQNKVYLTVPPDVFGDLQVLIEIDPDDQIAEIDETNNVAAFPLTVRQLCTSDPYEPANNAIATAPMLTPPYDSVVAGDMLTACANDADVYAFDVPAGQTATVRIDNMVVWTYGDTDLFLLDAFGVQLARSDALDTTFEELTWTNGTASTQTVYLQVLPFRSDYTNTYDLSVTVQ